jgi:hypothetical protein
LSPSSPVMPKSWITGLPIARDSSAVTIAQPADGPSFFVAPSGTCMRGVAAQCAAVGARPSATQAHPPERDPLHLAPPGRAARGVVRSSHPQPRPRSGGHSPRRVACAALRSGGGAAAVRRRLRGYARRACRTTRPRTARLCPPPPSRAGNCERHAPLGKRRRRARSGVPGGFAWLVWGIRVQGVGTGM